LLLLELGALEYEYPPLEYDVYELPWLLTPFETGVGILMTKAVGVRDWRARQKSRRARLARSVSSRQLDGLIAQFHVKYLPFFPRALRCAAPQLGHEPR
jgi:hypothetical protein